MALRTRLLAWLAMAAGGRCELCTREVSELTLHHLVPRSRHRDRRVRQRYDRDQLRTATARVCRPCHKQLHALIDEKTLARDYDSIAALRGHPELARFLAWIADKPGDLRIAVHRRQRRR